MDIRIIIKIDDLIVREASASPEIIAQKLNISERTVYNYIKFMKDDLEAPIVFSRINNTYKYNKPGRFQFKWM
jgi:transcriptional antiterminator